jgi:hypothetical protein
MDLAGPPDLPSKRRTADDMLASCRKGPRLLAANALDMDSLEPARPHHLRDPPGVIPIGLHCMAESAALT